MKENRGWYLLYILVEMAIYQETAFIFFKNINIFYIKIIQKNIKIEDVRPE
jgi:hypothetical protein